MVSTRAGPSAHSARTRMPLAAHRAAKPSRTMAWSSANTTVVAYGSCIGPFLSIGTGEYGAETSSVVPAGPLSDIDPAAQRGGLFADGAQPDAGAKLAGAAKAAAASKPAPLSRTVSDQAAAARLQARLHPGGARVLRHVGERLLRGTVEQVLLPGRVGAAGARSRGTARTLRNAAQIPTVARTAAFEVSRCHSGGCSRRESARTWSRASPPAWKCAPAPAVPARAVR